jgi:hypothetical protein
MEIALERLGDVGTVAEIPGLNGLVKDKKFLKFKAFNYIFINI